MEWERLLSEQALEQILSKHGESFGIPGFAVNGMNPVSVYLSALKAVKWVRMVMDQLYLK